jgi:hypothetical protein
MQLSKSWLTRPLFVCPPRIARVLKVASLVALLLLIVAPGLVTLAWQLRHGNTIDCRGKAIFVPARWIAEIGDNDDARLTKLPLVVSLKPGAGDLSMISVGRSLSPHGEDVEVQYKTFESLFWNLHSDLGEAISGPIRIGSGPQEAFCMEGATPGTTRSSASCAIEGGKWTAEFIGDKKDMQEFYAIVRRLN